MDQEKDLTKDPRWVEAQVAIQQGQWEDALALLRDLEKEYPNDPRVRSALVDIELRATFSEEQGTATDTRRRRIRIPRRVWMAAVVFFVLVSLGYTLFVGYHRYVAPQLQERARQQELAALYQQAQQSFGAGDLEAAAAALQQLLQLDPENAAARDLLAKVETRQELEALYDRAVTLQEQGRLAEALATFRQIAAREPSYRDVQQRIGVLEETLKVQDVFEQAEAAFEQKDWETAATLYEEVRSLDVSYEKARVTERLYTAYLRLAETSLAEGTVEGVQAAWEAVRQALRYNPGGEEARALRDDIRAYLRGLSAFNEQNYVDAVRYWALLLEKKPDFAGGLLAKQLYQAYLALAKEAEAEGNLPLAIHYYSLASAVPGVDAQEAKDRLGFLFLLITPTPTPTPTPTATPTPSPTPTFTPTPAPLPLSAYVGWIAFKTDRRGRVEIWVMRPDGCCARPVADPENYEKIRAKQAYSPDGKYRVYAESPPNNSSVVDLYVWRYDVPETWQHKYLLVGNGSINYDPVWSPDGAWIAFVSQVTGNDEIWKVSSDFFNPKKPIQLTSNSWEWDKSPTWSPDGKYIAFWSNRVTGRKQIWVMSADGSNPRNISNNPYNDWDPVWLWPSYFEGED